MSVEASGTQGSITSRSLVRRVALSSALAAALGGALAALVGGLTASAWLVVNEDREVLLAARDFSDEITEELHEAEEDDTVDERRHFSLVHGERTLANLLIHEMEDVKLPGGTAAVLDGVVLEAGDATLPEPAMDTCLIDRTRQVARRVCAVPFDPNPAVGKAPSHKLLFGVSAASDEARSSLVLGSTFVGALIGALLGGLSSWWVVRRVLEPLERLRRQVRQIEPGVPVPAGLTVHSSYGEIEDLRAAIRELVERLGGALDQARAFSAQAAHELRTPLTSLRGEIDLLLEAPGAPPELEKVRLRLVELTTLVQRLLVLSSASDTTPLDGRAVDWSDVTARVVASLSPDDSARVEIAVEQDLLVRGDEDLLAALLQNAVDNALKFSTETVRVRAFGAGDRAVVEVTDDGLGVPEHERERVFAPFYRSADARASGTTGHGVGLALIAHVARKHGGSAQFVARESGTCLRLELPRWQFED